MADRKRDVQISLSTDATQLRKGLTDSEKRIEKFAAVGVKAGQAMATAFAAAAAAVATLTMRGIAAGDTLDEAAEKIGVTVRELAGLRYAAQFAGVSSEQLDTALAKLARTVSDAASGGKTAEKSFKALGLSAEELRKLPLDEQLRKVSDAMTGVANDTDKVRIAQELFGKAGTQLIPLLNQGSAAIKRQSDEARELGLTLDETQRKHIVAASDGIDKLKQAVEGAALQFAGEFSADIARVSEAVVILTSRAADAAIEFIDLTRRFLGFKRAVEDMGDGSALKELYRVNEDILRLRNELDNPRNGFRRARVRVEEDLNKALAEQEKILGNLQTRDDEREVAATERAAKLKLAAEDPIDGEKAQEEKLKRFSAYQQLRLDTSFAFLDAERARRDEAAQHEIDTEVMLFDLFKDIEEQKAALREQSNKDALSKLVAGSAALASHSKKAFKVNQAAAIAETTIKGFESAKKALANSGGYPWGLPAMAADIAHTAAQIAAIKKTSFGGGTTPSAAGTPTVNGNPVQSGQTITVQGINPNDMFSGRQLVELLSQAQKDGARLVLAQ